MIAKFKALWAMGAATADPEPPFSIITDAIYLGLSMGA